jgi:release factor glutamine methyltransferase
MTTDVPPDPDLVARLRTAGCVYAEEEARLLVEAADTREHLDALADRRVAGVPLEHLLGWAEFCGRRILVEPGVFVPRPRTELLAREAAALAAPGAVVVELCCGAAGVSTALAGTTADVEIHAVDIDQTAVWCARRNLADTNGTVYLGDLYDPLPAHLRHQVDVLVANAPYVPSGELDMLPPEARHFERPVALDGGADGLDVVRRVITPATDWLSPTGRVVLECSERQAADVASAMRHQVLRPKVVHDADLAATVVIGAPA